MLKGKINVQTENIFPIIKKFLYSDHEIFLREIVSNAVDATQKLKTLSSTGDFKGEIGDISVEIILDKEAKTLTIKDKGIGMTAEEIEKYINQIAFSSAEEFVNKFKTKTEAESNAIIGHFGLGFYSSFMVSDKVAIRTKSYKGEKASYWECDGSPEYTLKEDDKEDRGTEIILHIDEENVQFLEESKTLELLRKYCSFLPVPIKFGKEKYWEPDPEKKDKDGNPEQIEKERDRFINNTNPLWKKTPVDCKDEDYKSFYRELYPMTFEEPLFHIHLNVDYPFNLTGILYFPKVKKNIEVQQNKIQLYCNQVFVTDSVEGIVPQFLTLLHGVIDSPDIPLNVSRSYLQSDQNVKKISGYIMKKVADKLEELFKNDREEFEKKWDDIRVFIDYGMISEEKFFERAKKFYLFKNIDGKYFTIEDYQKHVEETQKDKNNKTIYLYSNDTQEQHSFIQAAKERGYDVLELGNVLDNHLINTFEQKLTDVSFARVDSNTVDKLIQKDEADISRLDDKQKETIKEAVEKNVDKAKFMVDFANLNDSDLPLLIMRPEFMRRMKDMSALGGGGMMGMGNLPDTYQLIVNTNHPICDKILAETDGEKQTELIKHSLDLALLSQNLLKGEELTNFIKRSAKLI
ncbi:MAG: molecular chaperone HtpG [Hyphomicrobiales bacterium]